MNPPKFARLAEGVAHVIRNACKEDVGKIRKHPLVPHNIPTYGYIYDVKTGKLIEVPNATVAGAVK